MSNLSRIYDPERDAKRIAASQKKSELIKAKREYVISLIEEKNAKTKTKSGKIIYPSFSNLAQLEALAVSNGIEVEYPAEILESKESVTTTVPDPAALEAEFNKGVEEGKKECQEELKEYRKAIEIVAKELKVKDAQNYGTADLLAEMAKAAKGAVKAAAAAATKAPAETPNK